MDFNDYPEEDNDMLEKEKEQWDDLILEDPGGSQGGTAVGNSTWLTDFKDRPNFLELDIREYSCKKTDEKCMNLFQPYEKDIVQQFEWLPTFLVSLYMRHPGFRARLNRFRQQHGIEAARSYVWALWSHVICKDYDTDYERIHGVYYSEYRPLKQAQPFIRAMRQAGKTRGETARAMLPILRKLAKDLGNKPWDAGPDGLYSPQAETYQKDSTYLNLSHTGAFHDYTGYARGDPSTLRTSRDHLSSKEYVQQILKDGMAISGLLLMDSSMLHHEGLLLIGEKTVCGAFFVCLKRFLTHLLRLLRNPSILPKSITLKEFKEHLSEVTPGLQAHYNLLQSVPGIEEWAFARLANAEMVHSKAWHESLRNHINEDIHKVMESAEEREGTLHILPLGSVQIISRMLVENARMELKAAHKDATKHDVSHHDSDDVVPRSPSVPEDLSKNTEFNLNGGIVDRSRGTFLAEELSSEEAHPSAILPELEGRRMLVEDVNKMTCWLARMRGETGEEPDNGDGQTVVVVLHDKTFEIAPEKAKRAYDGNNDGQVQNARKHRRLDSWNTTDVAYMSVDAAANS